MDINFPSSPTDGQTVVAGTSTYTWNNATTTWDLSVTTVLGPTGPAGAAGAAGAPYGNIDGGTPSSIYGGISPLDGGNVGSF